MHKLPNFEWTCHPQAENLLLSILGKAIKQNSFLASFEKELFTLSSTRLFDWLDFVSIDETDEAMHHLKECGFVLQSCFDHYRIFYHPLAQFPRIVVYDQPKAVIGVAILCDSIAHFLMVRGLCKPIEGSPYSHYRRCLISDENKTEIWMVERRGTLTIFPTIMESNFLNKYLAAKEKWQTRARHGLGKELKEDETLCLNQAIEIALSLVKDLGVNMAACLILECERDFWQSRNVAGQIQKNRQDALGLGWSNHDHHTFRSSRHHFSKLIHLFEILGFECRERFYAGNEAGWGAQVMENSVCHLVLFLDVDLSADELGDISHLSLSQQGSLGTVGLWCALHGDSILQGGMHHLEAQFIFEYLKKDLNKVGIEMMEPFSAFSYLRQAFTKGEKWPVDPLRLKYLVENKYLSNAQANDFLKKGAIGSHLENLQRREGFKGFNQKNVSVIIKKTDPRATHE